MKRNFKFNQLSSDEKKQITVLSIVVVLTCIILLGTSYAWFIVNIDGQKGPKIVAGTLDLSFDDIDSRVIQLTDQTPISDEDGLLTEGYTFKIKNVGSIDSDYSIYLDDVVLSGGENRLADRYVKYSLTKNNLTVYTDLVSDLNESVIDSGVLKVNTTNTYTLRVWLDEDNFDSSATNKVFKKKLRIETSQRKSNVVDAYVYNQTVGASDYCISGEEATCQKTECYKTKTENSCPAGTIIKYKVNDNDIINFHVMFDNGETMTMQSQKNMLNGTVWYDCAVNPTCTATNGPLKVLPALEDATSGWSNVNDQPYTMGTTVFKTNAYTGCSNLTTCNENTYTLATRSAKARMITAQEASVLGCGTAAQSCPSWMNNYLIASTHWGGTHEESPVGYWTMSVSNPAYAIYIVTNGNLNSSHIMDTTLGIRPVVEVYK